METNINDFVAISGNDDIPSKYRYEDEPKQRFEMEGICGKSTAPPGF